MFDVATTEAFGSFGRSEMSALGALIDYLELTQKGRLPILRTPILERTGSAMQIDASTRRNLELTHAMAGGRAGSLLACVDRTLTAAGARLLERRIASPSCDLGQVNLRLDAVGRLQQDNGLRQTLRRDLRHVPDIDRALSRLSLDRGGPRDLGVLRDGIGAATQIAETLVGAADIPAAFDLADLDALRDLGQVLDEALVAELPLRLSDGGVFAPGYDADLDAHATAARRRARRGRGDAGRFHCNNRHPVAQDQA